MIVLALLFGFGILMNGSGFAAIQGRFAERLELPGAFAIPFIPWIALGLYVGAILAIRKVKRPVARWAAFVVVTILSNVLILYPLQLLHRGSVAIPVKDLINRESAASFEERYSVKWVSYSSSLEGSVFRVPRDRYSKEMAEFVSGLIAGQAKQAPTWEKPPADMTH